MLGWSTITFPVLTNGLTSLPHSLLLGGKILTDQLEDWDDKPQQEHTIHGSSLPIHPHQGPVGKNRISTHGKH